MDMIQSPDVYTGERTMELTTSEAAAILEVSVRRVQAMIKDGVLPARKHGRDYFVFEEDVRWLKEQDRTPGWTNNSIPPSKRN